MPRATSPAVLEGMRAPRSVRLDDMRAEAERPSLPQPPSGGEGTVYVSSYRRYRVQIAAPHGFADPTTGRKTAAGELIAAVFEEGVYRNNHRNPVTRALIDETLQSNPYFGAFGSGAHFWLAADQNARTEAARVESALNTLRSMPKDAVDKFVAELKAGEADDHVLPPPMMTNAIAGEGQTRGVRPIPPPQ